jgi:hypothetical protein
MNRIIISVLALLITVQVAFPKPGETYTLTGKEKSIEEIVKADMQMFPELYKGESLKFYIVKFKNQNRIGKRKLKPGDQLTFPTTKASLEEEKDTFRKMLIGKWETQTDNSKTSIITEYKENGTVLMDCMNGAFKYEGTWKMEDGYLQIKFESANFKENISSKKGKRRKIIQLTDTIRKTQVKGLDVVIEKRIN